MQQANAMPSAAGQVPHHNRPSWFKRKRNYVSNLVRQMDDSVSKSPVGQLFRLKGSGHVSDNPLHRLNRKRSDTSSIKAQGN